MTRRLAILAHFDPTGGAAGHVLRQLDQLSELFDDIVVTSTTDLTPQAHQQLSARSTLIVRENIGQDFAGWQSALAEHFRPGHHDEVLLTNDTYIGFLQPLSTVFEHMRHRPVEIWGSHESNELTRHLQSYFLLFTRPALQSRAFAEFWRRLRPTASRYLAIRQQEIGLSQQMLNAGFEIAGHFTPTAEDIALAKQRERWWKAHLLGFQLEDKKIKPRPHTEPLNPAIVHADAALDAGRMLLVKIDTLRYDPYFLGSEHLLSLCEERFPEQFDGVRAYLRASDPFYPIRPESSNGRVTLSPQEQNTIGYHLR